MILRRLAPARVRGVVAPVRVAVLAVLLAGALTACSSGPVELATPDLSAADADACRSFVGDLPVTLAEQAPVASTPSDAPGAAYGDPVITVSCGVAIPSDYFPGAICQVAGGVGWYVPEAVLDDPGSDVTMTAVGYRPVVQLEVPHDYRPDGVAAIFTELAPVVRKDLRVQMRCR